ncbi:MAG TPA: Crp/Fnr family transcriptional regulator, partial [Candidatus Avacidaminococcus intestinavium]|nr:Crp/Fnr family transcriptional regulator [Candidatus Avacidaminococcus intestinavium]
MENLINLLAQTALFYKIAPVTLPATLKFLEAQKLCYEKNQTILSADNSVPLVGIVLEGSVAVLKDDFWGNRAILTKLTVGDIFAEAFACANLTEIPVNVIATEKTTVLFINYLKVTQSTPAFDAQSQLMLNMLTLLARKNIFLTQKIEHLMKRSTREKILSFLSEQATLSGQASFDIPLNRQELADYLAVDRSALSKELSRLQKEG